VAVAAGVLAERRAGVGPHGEPDWSEAAGEG
jgi:hypothetical protein